MKFTPLEIPDVILIEPRVFGDDRGFFLETFNSDKFKENGINEDFVQDNWSRSGKGTLRGLHFQKDPHAQGKLVRVMSGSVFDVVVDIRPNSEYYGKWVSAVLSEENKNALYVPQGFAHGFYVLSDTADFVYKCTNLYAPQAEGGIIWNDPDIGIEWPLVDDIVLLSDKDKNNPLFKNL